MNCIIYAAHGATEWIDEELTECVYDDKMTKKQIKKMCSEITENEQNQNQKRFDRVYPYYYIKN